MNGHPWHPNGEPTLRCPFRGIGYCTLRHFVMNILNPQLDCLNARTKTGIYPRPSGNECPDVLVLPRYDSLDQSRQSACIPRVSGTRRNLIGHVIAVGQDGATSRFHFTEPSPWPITHTSARPDHNPSKRMIEFSKIARPVECSGFKLTIAAEHSIKRSGTHWRPPQLQANVRAPRWS